MKNKDGSAVKDGTYTKELLKGVNKLARLIMSMSGWRINEALTLVIWCIATYGYDKVQKFPVLVIFGQKNTGKTTALKMIIEMANPPKKGTHSLNSMRIKGGQSVAVNRDKLAEGGTHVVEEADGFKEYFVNDVFDKFDNETVIKQERPTGRGWDDITLVLNTALALHRRRLFKDEATSSRAIQLRTVSVDLGAEGKQRPDMRLIAEHLELIEEIAEFLSDTWEEIPEDDINRTAEKWNPLRHVAEKLGHTDFVRYVDAEKKRELQQYSSTVSDETDVAVFRTIMRLVLPSNRDGYPQERVKTQSVKRALKNDDDIELTSQNINSMAVTLGFEQKSKGGHSWIYLHSDPDKRIAQLKEIADNIGWFDEALNN